MNSMNNNTLSLDESRILKFKNTIHKLNMGMDFTSRELDYNPLLYIVDSTNKNPYLTCIWEAMTTVSSNSFISSMNEAIGVKRVGRILGDKVEEAAKFVKVFLKYRNSNYNVEYFIFWALMAAAVDETVYREKLSVISDFAFVFGFTDEMMADWVHAVKSVLTKGNFGDEQEYITEEGRSVFGK